MIKLSGLISPCIIGLASYSPTVRSIKEAGGDGKPQPAVNAAPAPSGPVAGGQDTAEPQVDSTIDSVQAADDAIDTDNIALDSNTGVAFLLASLVTKARDENQLDSLASSMVEKLRIKDFDLFKKETAKFSNIQGYSELCNSISNMVDSTSSSNDGDSSGGGEGGGGGEGNGTGGNWEANGGNAGQVNETIWKNYRPLNK